MVQRKRAGAVWLLSFMVSALVAACGGGGGGGGGANGGSAAPAPANPTYSISGSVSGLTGTGLVLQDNGGDNLTVNASSTFVFPKALTTGAAYKVTVLTQPALQTCSVSSGVGAVNGANVTNVSVICASTAYTVSGTVSGLTGTGMVLLNNGGDALNVNANGAFTFAAKVATGANYNVTVGTPPSGPAVTCTVNGGSGAMGGANITGVSVICSSTAYTVSGTATGLAGSGLVLQDNNGDNLSIAANGTFTFAAKVANGAAYNVTAFSQPTNPSQTCIVSSGTGTMAGANITSVAVNCTTNTYTVSGTVTGLAGTGLVLLDNGGDNLSIAANGTFTFVTPVASNGNYAVTVGTQPGGPTQTCTVSTGTGIVTASNITNVAVVCSTNTYTVSGTVTGLSGTGLVLLNNGGNNLAVAAGSGTFTFTTPVASGGTYTVTVGTQPSGPTQTCSVTNFTGPVTNANIINVAVLCSTNTYTISATVSGYAGTGLVLMDNGGNLTNATANGTYVFTTPIASGATYNVGVSSQPTGPSQTCSVTSGTGTVTSANITNVTVLCSTNTYTISGTVSGMTGTGLTLQDNGGDTLAIAGNGAFSFATKVVSGANYNVTVFGQPGGPAQFCSVTGGAGTVTGSNITNVTVTCVNFYTIGGTVTGLAGTGLVLQDNNGDNLSVAVNGPFVFATPRPSGTAYSVTVLTQPVGPAQTCAVSAGAGTVPGTNVTSVSVYCFSPSTPRYAFVADPVDNSVSSYAVDAAAGRLKYIGMAASPRAASVTVDPSGRYAYVPNNFNNTVSQYTIGVNGSLTAMAASAVAAGAGPYAVTVDPTGRYVYVTNQGGGSVSQYTIGVTGALTPMATPSVTAGPGTSSVTVTPSGQYAYVANTNNGTVSQYTIGITGALAPMAVSAVAATGGAPYGAASVTVDPTGRYAYVPNSFNGAAGNSISQFTIGAGGALTPMATPTVPAGVAPLAITIDPSARYAYVTNQGSGSVSQYTVGAGGALVPMVPPTVATGLTPSSVTVDASGKYAYVTSLNNKLVYQYAIGANGALTPITPAAAPGRQSPMSIAMTHGAAAVQVVPKYAYVANSFNGAGGNSISQYTIGAGGGLTAMAASAVAAGAGPTSVAVDPSGLYAYAADAGSFNFVSQYTIGANGGLAPMAIPTVAAGTNPYAITTDPTGQYVLVADINSNDVAQFGVGPGGALIGMGSIVGLTGANSVAVDPTGRYLYVTVPGSNLVAICTLLVTGAYGGSGSAATGTAPSSVAVDPSGQYVYVTNKGSNTVSQYMLGTGGTLTAMAVPTVASGSSPASVAVDPSGMYVYVANSLNGVGGNTISQYTIGAGGALTAMAVPTVAAGNSPASVTVDASGKYVYVTNSLNGAGGNTISQYAIGAGGALTPMAVPTVAAGAGPVSITTTSTWQ